MVVTVASVRQQLTNLAHSGGSHKDQAEKYEPIAVITTPTINLRPDSRGPVQLENLTFTKIHLYPYKS